MKKTLDTKPGKTVEVVGTRRAAKLIEAAVERRSGLTIGEITRDLFAQIQSGKPREIGTDDDLEDDDLEVIYPDFWFDDTLVAAANGHGYFNMFRALRAAHSVKIRKRAYLIFFA